MDLLLLLAGLAALLVLMALGFVFLLYIVPVRTIVHVIICNEKTREGITVSWGFLGIRVLHGSDRSAAELLAGSRVLYTHVFEPGEDAGFSPVDKKIPGPETTGEERTEPDLPPPGVLVRISRSLIPQFRSIFSLFWQESRFDEARGTVTIGLGDPVLTGEFYGCYWAARFILEAMNVYIDVEPVFDREVIACDIEIAMQLRHPLTIIVAVIRLMLHPAVREIAGLVRTKNPSGVGA